MKKIAILMLAVLAGMGISQAQNFKLETKSGELIVEGGTIEIAGVVDNENTFALDLNLVITNTTSNTVQFKPEFNISGLPSGSFLAFCGRECYGDITNIPVISLEPNEILGDNEDVHLQYTPNADENLNTEVVIPCTFNDVAADKALHFNVKFKPSSRPTANDRNELAGVRVYPNPSTGVFSLDVPERAQVEIFAVNGQLVRQMEVMAGKTAVQIDRNGVYFMRVRANGKTAVKRIVIG